MHQNNETKPGPAAPRDPVVKRPYFYIMHSQEVYGSPQPDGRGIQFIYEDGRFADCARRVGNITDEHMLEELPQTAGFRRIVHSMGVSITEPGGIPVRFVMQMYPKTLGNEATVISRDMLCDGNEQIIDLSEVDWKDDDNIIGQIRFEFEEPDHLANVDVRLYLNDGFTAPEQSADSDVDFTSDRYSEMISSSLVSPGNIGALKRIMDKAAAGEKITLSFIGGSVTQGAGATPIHKKSYARQFADSFADRFCGGDRSKVELIKAGVGGTPSELGMIRFGRDVLRDGLVRPDLVVIEFAVNDAGDETEGACFESLVRKAMALEWHPAVVLLFAVFSDDYNLQDRLMPVGEHYRLPMVSLKNAVSGQFKLTPEGGRVITRNQYFYDQFHPSNNGHRVMSDCLMNLFEKAAADNETVYDEVQWKSYIKDVLDIDPAISGRFEAVELLDKKDDPTGGRVSIKEGSFGLKDETLQRVEMDSDINPVAEFANNWHYDGSKDSPEGFIMEIECRRLLAVFKDSDDPGYGKAVCLVDGEKVLEYNPLDIGWTHCNAVIIADDDERAPHRVEIKPAPGNEHKKFTILGFGVVD